MILEGLESVMQCLYK